MPVRRTRAPFRRRGKKVMRRRVPRTLRFNPQPVFTETCRLTVVDTSPPVNYQMNSNSTGQLRVQMDMLPQLSQYSALYQKYRILKVTYLCLGTFNTQASDVNVAQSNISTAVSYGMGRIAHVIQSSPSVAPPTSENSVLICNGARVISARPKFQITHKPVPNILDANGNQLSMKSPWLQFVNSGFNIPHGAVNWSYILPSSNPAFDPLYAVYAKITFQLADPR